MIPNSKKIYLCSPDLSKRTILNSVHTDEVDFHAQIKGYSELSFSVDRFISIDGEFVESNGYGELKTYMYLYLEDIGYFIMEPPEITCDGNNETKQIVAYSVEKEFEARDWNGIKINCGTTDSLEYSYTDEDNVDPYGFAIRYVTMLNTSDTRLSFLHLILEKMPPKWYIQYVSPNLINAKIPAIDVDNENLYAVMTSEVAPRLSCIFVFDYLHFGISVFHKDELDDQLDTGIFISFRNLENNVSITTDSDSVFTRFTVQGDNGLEFRDVNYGENTIINLEYFLGEPYMEQEMADKYEAWKAFRSKYIDQYIEYAKYYSSVMEKREERIYRVPSDASYWTNWNSMNEEGLQENLAYYQNFLEKLQISVDDRAPEEMFDSEGNYIPKENNGEVNHEWYEEQLYNQVNIYGGYYTYVEILKYIIPYIELAISNLNQIDKEDPDYSITTDWQLYGLEEIKGVRDSYLDQIQDLDNYKYSWAEIQEMDDTTRKEKNLEYLSEEEYEATTGRIEYKKLIAELGDTDTPDTILWRIQQLEEEIAQLESEMERINNITNEFARIVKYNVDDEILGSFEYIDGEIPGIVDERRECVFDENEIRIFEALLKDTDYTNSNILTSESMSLDNKFQSQSELLTDAEDKLSEVSQPQYKFSVNLDNFFRLDDYADWTKEFGPSSNPNKPQLGLLRFIRVSLRDDYAVKLRVIGYRWNPCEITPELTLEFSNMITSRSGRSDLTELLDQSNYRGSKNSIRFGNGTASSEQEYVSALMELLKDNSIFIKQIQAIAGTVTASGTSGGSGGAGGVNESAVRNIIGGYVSGGGIDSYLNQFINGSNLQINIGNITGESGEFESLFAEKLSADFIAAKVIDANSGKFNELVAKIIESEEINALKITVDQIDAENGDFTNLSAKILEAGTITVDMITGESGQFDNFFVNNLDVGNVFGNNAQFKSIVANEITSSNIIAGLGDFTSLFAESAFINQLNAGVISSFENNVYTEAVKSLVAANIAVADLKVGDIVLSNTMRVISENGALLMNGEVLQFAKKNDDDNSYDVGIQIGYDNTSRPSLIIMDENGALLFTSQGMIGQDGEPIQKGISAEAIANELIVNQMIHDGTIEEDKLGFDVQEKLNKITIDRVYTTAGEPFFGTEYTTFEDFTDSVFNAIDDVKGRTYTWIAYADNSRPLSSEFLDGPEGARYVGIAPNQSMREKSYDFWDYQWFALNNTGDYVVETTPIYYKSLYDDIDHIPSPTNEGLALSVSEGIVTLSQGSISTEIPDWSPEKPEKSSGYYLWTSMKIKLSDGTYVFTTPVRSTEWDEEDNTIGGAQLIRNSKTLIDERIYWY